MGLFSSIGSIIGKVGGALAPINPLISAGATLAGGIIQNSSAKQQAQDQMAFQENMSNTSYQRQMADMMAAGINPILSAKMGGASTPSGAAASVENVVGPAVASANQVRMQNMQMQNMHETNKLIEAQAYQARSQGVKADTEAALLNQDMLIKQAAMKGKLSEAEFNNIMRTGELDAVKALPLPSAVIGGASLLGPTVGKAASVLAIGAGARAATKLIPFSANSAKSVEQWKGGLIPPQAPVRSVTK